MGNGRGRREGGEREVENRRREMGVEVEEKKIKLFRIGWS